MKITAPRATPLALKFKELVGGAYNCSVDYFGFPQPALYGRLRRADWIKKGGKYLGQRLRDKALALMDCASSADPSA